MIDGLWLQQRLTELKIGFIFLTRLSLVHDKPVVPGELSRSLWSAPLVGIVVGLTGASVYAIATALHVPPLPAAALSPPGRSRQAVRSSASERKGARGSVFSVCDWAVMRRA